MIRLEMKIYNTILIGKQLKDWLNHQENFINMNILQVKIYYHPINNIIEQARFTYSPLGKAFEKKKKSIEDQGEKQVDALNALKFNSQFTIEDVIPENALINDETKKEFDKIKEIEKNIDRDKLIYETNEYTYSFKSKNKQ